MEKELTYFIEDKMFEIYTPLPISIKVEKKNWFQSKATVTLKEYDTDEPKLYVQPKFEIIANDIFNKHLKGKVSINNVTWLHYNEYQDRYNKNSLDKFTKIEPLISNNKIVDANWIFLDERFAI